MELKRDLAGVMGKISSSMLSLELEINLHVTKTMTPQRTWIGDQTTIGVSELFRPLGGLRALERSKVDMTMTTSGTNAAHRWNFLYFSMLKSVLIFNVRNMMGRNDATRKKRIWSEGPEGWWNSVEREESRGGAEGTDAAEFEIA
jgi:hypothetical protein